MAIRNKIKVKVFFECFVSVGGTRFKEATIGAVWFMHYISLL
jgi:hypothetical protein